jgi:multidrug efflux system outer membrane protein
MPVMRDAGTRTAGPAAIAALCAIVLSGCALTKVNPETPELMLPQALPAAQPTTGGDAVSPTASLPDPWWQIFADEELDRLIDEGLARNTDVAVAAARVAQARAEAQIVGADRLPALDIAAGASRSRQSVIRQPVQGARVTSNEYYVNAGVSYELDLWGRYQHASEAARARLLASELDRETVLLSLSGDIARGYFALQAATRQLHRARETLVNREESLRIERIREQGGESDEFTLRRVEAEVAAARTSALEFELEEARRANALAVLLGRSPREMIDERIPFADERLHGPAPTLPAGLPSAVLENRPDIRAAEAQLEAAAADMGTARAALFPSISLTGVFGWASLELEDLFAAPNEEWSVAGSLLQPVFYGGRLRAGVSRADALRQQRRAEYARAVQIAFREVLDGLQGQNSLHAIEASATGQATALARATELAELRYREGDISYLELLDVRRDYYQTQVNLISSRRDALSNAVDLALALGAGIGETARR